MKPFRKILVPLDFSQHSQDAVDLAVDVARRYDAAIGLLHVYSPSNFFFPTEAAAVLLSAPQLNDLMHDLVLHLQSMRAEIQRLGVSQVDTDVRQGVPHTEILEFARNNHYDLIVMSTHGRTGVRHAVLGSVAERVLRAAHCPVLITRMNGDDANAKQSAKA